jgi:putative heme-binding domain-containing protein
MPVFPARARTLAEGVVAQHGTPEFDAGRPASDASLVAQGELLTRTEGGFSCIQCHGVGERKAFGPFGDRGVNFTLIEDRLRYDFYHRWMRAPQRVDPRTKMPAFTSDGRTTAVHAVLGGDARRQFDALWHYIASAPTSSRTLVRHWTIEELAPALDGLASGRSFANGEKLFESMSCKQCHQVKGAGGAIGPDLTGVATKHAPLAMLRELIEPSAVIEDKYRHHVLFTKDDDMISGLLVAEDQESLSIVEDALDPKAVTKVLRSDIDERRRANVSSMPTGLLDMLEASEILDLMAYLRSGGNPADPAFTK